MIDLHFYEKILFLSVIFKFLKCLDYYLCYNIILMKIYAFLRYFVISSFIIAPIRVGIVDDL